jgi:hypothetical protein
MALRFICVDGNRQLDMSLEDVRQLILSAGNTLQHNTLQELQGGSPEKNEHYHLDAYRWREASRYADDLSTGLMHCSDMRRIAALEKKVAELEKKLAT